MFYLNRRLSLHARTLVFVGGFASILDGFVSIASFGFVGGSFSLWTSRRLMNVLYPAPCVEHLEHGLPLAWNDETGAWEPEWNEALGQYDL
jgi:hypothetical protein